MDDRSSEFRLSRRALGFLVLAGVAEASGCHHKEKGSSGAAGARMGMVLADSGSPFDRAVEHATKGFADEQSITLLTADAQGQASEQVRRVEQLLQQNINFLVVKPIDGEKLRPSIQKAIGAKVAVLAVEREIPDTEVSCVIQYNQELAGQLAADYLGHRFKQGARVALLKGPDDPDQKARLAAFQAYLKEKFPKVMIAAEESAGGDARAAAGRLLKAHSGMQAVFAQSDALALAAAEAARSGNKGPIVIGCGGAPEAVQELQKPDSALALVLAALPQRIARNCVRIAGRIAGNKTVQQHFKMPVSPITRDNSGEYPGYEGELPRSMGVPWTSEIQIGNKRQQ